MPKELILLKSGEIALKGLNKHRFEQTMMKNIKYRLAPLGGFSVTTVQSITYVEPLSDGIDMDEAAARLRKIFGVAALTRSAVADKSFPAIRDCAVSYFSDALTAARSFKVSARRSDKTFPMKSPEICAELGHCLLTAFPHLRVDVHHPDVTVTVEIREHHAYLHGVQIPGAGGIPVGTGGRALLLLSGGIDSPVAGYMMAKRGLEIAAVHFASPPYTSDRALQKVVDLAGKLTAYTGRIHLFIVPFTKLQEELAQRCPEDFFTILMRRCMMRIAERIAVRNGCGALITGESLGQVASQTMQAIGCTNAVTALPVLRPLIGFDKEEIIAVGRRLGTFETSILPYEDCCTLFTPRHPKTRPSPEAAEAVERSVNLDPALLEDAADGAECRILRVGS